MRRYREDGQRLVRLNGYYVRRPQAHPVHDPWTVHARDAAEALVGVVIVLILMFVLPVLIWLVAS